jgi:AraC-like DNA-binding protein
MAYYYTKDSGGARGLNRSNHRRTDAPVAINSIGEFKIDRPFVTDNVEGRVDFYLMYILEGKLHYTFDNGDAVLGKGSFVIFPPGYRYRYRPAHGEGNIHYCWCHFSGSAAEEMLSALGFGRLPARGRFSRSEEILFDFSRISDAAVLPEPLRTQVMGGFFSSVLATLAKSKSGEGTDLPLDRSIAYINLNYASPITVDELAAMENLSPSRYSALFKERFGVAPIEHVINLRIRASLSLLSDTDMQIKEIAELVGYSDGHFFSRMFAKRMHRSPAAYRRDHKSEIISLRE